MWAVKPLHHPPAAPLARIAPEMALALEAVTSHHPPQPTATALVKKSILELQ
jgi:hypothetical protein